MKYASSIKYGGNLIDAIDCDYDSYKHLGLVCPECKNPVFVRAEHTRRAPSSGEVVKVGQSFAHFKAQDPAIVLMCENRVGAYNRQDLEKKAAAAKNQRLKLLHRWFWDIYYRCFELERRLLGIEKEENRLRFRLHAHQTCTSSQMQTVIQAFANFNPQERVDIIASHVEGLAEDTSANPESIFVKTKMQFLSSVDRTLHCMICNEVVEFLAAKRQLPLLEQIVTVSKIILEQSPSLQQQIAAGLDTLPAAIMRHVIISLCFIDWAGEFERLATK